MTEQIPKLLIVADDLTGALDGAAAFCADGVSVVVAVRPETLPQALASGADVVAVSTMSREVPAQLATRRVQEAVALADGRVVFKKVDSRLKGHVAAELDAIAGDCLFVAPAIPAFGRVVEKGYVTGFGVDTPIDINSILAQHAGRSIIPDCNSEAALDVALAKAPEGAVMVGARGLSFALARRFGLVPSPSPSPSPSLPVSGRVAFAIGSTDPITLSQVDALQNVQHINAPAGKYIGQFPHTGDVVLQATRGGTASQADVAKRFAESFCPLAMVCQTLVLTGGATAEAVLAKLGVDVLQMRGELQPGLPVSYVRDLCIVTKSGGFGGPETLSQLLAERNASDKK